MTPEPTFADLGEDRIVARILARIPSANHVLIGPGDDAAVSESPGRLVSTADMLVEGEDFLQGWLDPVRLGIKAAAQNLADVRAMGAQPTGLLLSLAAPGHTPAAFVDGLLDGLVEEAARTGASVLGGDLSDAPQIVIAVTALGSLPVDQVPFTRDAAQPGFDVFLGGQTGWAAAGLDLLLASGGSVPTDASGPLERAIEAQRAPRPDYACIDSLRLAVDRTNGAPDQGLVGTDQSSGGPGRAALIDLSDGLGSDAGRMARASGVLIDFDAEALDALADDLIPVAVHVLALKGIPIASGGNPIASKGTPEPYDSARALARRWVLTGGEDHGFLAAVARGVDPIGWTRIGRVGPVHTSAVGSGGDPDVLAGNVNVAIGSVKVASGGVDVLIDGVPVNDSGFAAVDPDGGFRHFSGAGE